MMVGDFDRSVSTKGVNATGQWEKLTRRVPWVSCSNKCQLRISFDISEM